MPSPQIDVRPLKRFDHLMNTPIKVIATELIKIVEMFASLEEQFSKKVKMVITEALKNLKEEI